MNCDERGESTMKKFLSIVIAALMVAALAACGSAPASSAPASSGVSSSDASSAPASSEASSESSSSEAAGEVVTSQEGKLVVGTSADFAPYEFHILKDGKDQIVGFDMALAQAIADDLGLELVIKDMSFDSILIELSSGTIDLGIAGFSPDPERAESVDFSDYYYMGGQSLMIRKADADKYTSFESLKGLPVGAQTGSIQEDLAKEHTPESSLVSLTAIPNVIMELKAGKIEAAFMETVVAEGYLATQDDLMIAMEVPYDVEGSAVAIKKGNDAMTAAVNATIKKVLENGDMDKFIQEANALAEEAIS